LQSPYALAIDAARDTIVQRAHQYKWLVIAASLTGVAAVGAALVLARWWPLAAVLLLPSAVMAFHALDQRAVHRWRRAVLAHWATGALQLNLLAGTLRQVPALPSSTVEGMVESLPDWPAAEVPLAARPALAQLQDAVAQIAAMQLLARAAAWGALALVALAAWASGQAALLAGWLVLPCGWLLWRAWQRLRTQRAHDLLLQAWRGASVDADAAAGWAARLSWQGVPPAVQAAWRAP
jgi:hypothetical protein